MDGTPGNRRGPVDQYLAYGLVHSFPVAAISYVEDSNSLAGMILGDNGPGKIERRHPHSSSPNGFQVLTGFCKPSVLKTCTIKQNEWLPIQLVRPGTMSYW